MLELETADDELEATDEELELTWLLEEIELLATADEEETGDELLELLVATTDELDSSELDDAELDTTELDAAELELATTPQLNGIFSVVLTITRVVPLITILVQPLAGTSAPGKGSAPQPPLGSILKRGPPLASPPIKLRQASKLVAEPTTGSM